MKNSRNPDDLQPQVREKWIQLEKACAAQGIHIQLTSTLRDLESQAEIYAQGRTAPGKIVSNAKPGYSAHNFGLAFDIVPVVNGKAVWDDMTLFTRIGHIGQSMGLEWGGAWSSFKDMPHFQMLGGKTLAQLRAEAGIA